MNEIRILNGRLSAADLTVSDVEDRKTGCFETMAFLEGRLPGLSLHLQRFERGCRFYNLEVPEAFVSVEAFRKTFGEHLENETSPQRIRWQIWKTDDGVTSWEWTKAPRKDANQPLKLLAIPFVDDENGEDSPFLKLNNRSKYRLAAQKVAENSCDQALVIGKDGRLLETDVGNVWMEKNGVWRSVGSVPGMISGTASVILQSFFKRENIPAFEDAIYLSNLQEDTALFVTNALFPLRATHVVIPTGEIPVRLPDWYADYLDFYAAYEE